MIGARAERLWQGETPTKRTFSDEKSYAEQNEIQEIRYKNTVMGDSQIIRMTFVIILRCWVLKKVTNEDKNVFLALLPRLEGDVKQQLGAAITKAEIETKMDELCSENHLGRME